MNLDIRHQFLLFLTVVCILPLALTGRYMLQEFNQYEVDKINTELELGLKLLSNNKQPSVGDLQKVKSVLPRLEFRVFDADKKLLYSTEPILKKSEVTFLNEEKPQQDIYREKIDAHRFRSMYTPVFKNEKNRLGYVVVSASENVIIAHNQQKVVLTRILVIGIGLFILLAAYLFNRSIISPVNSLARVSEAVISGDLSARVMPKSSDTKITEMMMHFNQMLDHLEEDKHLKETFVATLTHDLRTPLFAQKRIIEVLMESGALTENQQDMLKNVEQGNEQLVAMVNKLLEAYQYEAGAITLNLIQVNIKELVAEVFETINPILKKKAIVIDNRLDLDLLIEADAEQLQRVFQNLLGNAAENIQNERTITIQAEKKGDIFIINISDDGPGIEADILPHIFQRYYMGHLRQKLGSGLGLFICRMIVEQHQGSIKVKSELGKGTTFTIVLPIKQSIENLNKKELINA